MNQIDNKFNSIVTGSTRKVGLNSQNYKELHLEDIYQIEIELLNVCNLACPLCARSNPDVKEFMKRTGTKQLDLEKLKTSLKLFPKLTKVHLVGGICEPTLYKDFIPLIKWLKENNYSIMISTNASTLNEETWKIIGEVLQKDDEIRFAIDGSTQERYHRYRINGNLDKVIKNFIAFSDSKAFKVLQVIKFKHNMDYYEEEIKILQDKCLNKFDFVYRLNTGSEAPELGLEYPDVNKKKIALYQKIFMLSNKKTSEQLSKDIYCYSKYGFIYINHLGNFVPCCDRYEEFLLEESEVSRIRRPSIYNLDESNTDILIDYFNEVYDNIQNSELCIQYCHKLVQMIQEPDDRIVNPKK